MFIKAEDLSEILRQEQEYIDSLRTRWGGVELLPNAGSQDGEAVGVAW
jgi:hypothetical protein